MATLQEQLDALEARTRASLGTAALPDQGVFGDLPVEKPQIPMGSPDPNAETMELPQIEVAPGEPTLSDTGDVAASSVPGTPQPVDPAMVPQEPSPYGEEKDLTSQLDALEAKTRDSLDPEFTPQVGAMQQYIRQFNGEFAKTLGVIPEAANEILSFIGLGLWDPYKGQAPKYIAERMNAMGIDTAMATEKAKTFAAQFGQNTFTGLAQTAAMVAAAPSLAKQGISVVSEIAKSLAKNPKLALFAEIPAAAGATYGERNGGALGAVAGGMAGAMAGTGVVAGAAKVGRGVAGMASKLNPFGAKTPPLGDPLIDPSFDRSVAKVFAEQQVEGAKLGMTTALESAVRSIPSKGTPEQVQAATRTMMEKAEKAAARIESDFWKQVPLKAPVPMSPVRQGIISMEKEFADTPSQYPAELAEKFKELATPKRDPETGRMMKALPTVQRVRDMIGEVRLARKREEGLERQGMTPNYGLIRGYHMLEQIGHDAIERALPGDVSIQQARRVSTLYNDLFTRGGIADVMARRSRGDMSVPPGETVETLMKKFDGIQELLDVRNKLAYVRAPGGRSFALGKEERANVQAMVKEAEDSVRSMFREIADADPAKGAKWFAAREKDIRPMARVHAELSAATSEINAIQQQEKIFKTSALARFAQADTDKAINAVWLHKDPAGQARELMKTFKGNPDALEGLQQGLLNKFFTVTKGDPLKSKEVLFTPRHKDLLSTILDPSQMSRLEKITDITARLAAGDEKLLRHALLPGATLAGRIIGAQAGRQLSHILGGSNIQTPGIVSQAFRRGVERALRTMEPQQMLINAVLDPKMEKLLYSRTPHTTKEARELVRTMRRTVGAIEGVRQHSLNALSGEDDDK